jgi:hypothetical protein
MLLESISRASCELCHASTLLGRLTARQENCASQPGVLRNRFGQAKSASTNLTSFRHVVFENGRAVRVAGATHGNQLHDPSPRTHASGTHSPHRPPPERSATLSFMAGSPAQ